MQASQFYLPNSNASKVLSPAWYGHENSNTGSQTALALVGECHLSFEFFLCLGHLMIPLLALSVAVHLLGARSSPGPNYLYAFVGWEVGRQASAWSTLLPEVFPTHSTVPGTLVYHSTQTHRWLPSHQIQTSVNAHGGRTLTQLHVVVPTLWRILFTWLPWCGFWFSSSPAGPSSFVSSESSLVSTSSPIPYLLMVSELDISFFLLNGTKIIQELPQQLEAAFPISVRNILISRSSADT